MIEPESLETPYIKEQLIGYFTNCLLVSLEHGAISEEEFLELMEYVSNLETVEYEEIQFLSEVISMVDNT